MNPSNASSAPASATTSRTGPGPANDATAEKAAATLSESEFLEQQAAAAKSAISTAFAELRADIGKGVDPRLWMKAHPWIALASATAAGFAAAAAVVPSKEQQALRKLEAIERAMHRAREPEKTSPNGNGAAPEEKSSHRGFIAMLLHELFGVLKPAIISMISAHLTPPESAADEDGKHPPSEAATPGESAK